MREIWNASFGIGIVCTLSACSGKESDTEPVCGEPVLHDGVRVQVKVLDARAETRPLENATVILYDARTDPPIKLGAQSTARRGEFDFTADGVTDIPGCWSQLAYTLNAYGNGTRAAEIDVTGQLETALREGAALVIEEPMSL